MSNDREKKLKYLIDLVKLHDAPLGDEFERAYTDPLATDEDKDQFISAISHISNGGRLTAVELNNLAHATSSILVAREILKKFEKGC